jgi:hypothetical protein
MSFADYKYAKGESLSSRFLDAPVAFIFARGKRSCSVEIKKRG